MQSIDKKTFYSFRADANALGGFLEEPLRKSIPTLAPVSLPAAGGFATARSGAFNLDEIVSCSSAYTLVTGREIKEDGSFATLATAVVENLNILEVVTAERIVAQLTVTIPRDHGPRRISLGGTRFEGLRLAGRDSRPIGNSTLQQPGADQGTEGSTLTWRDILVDGFEAGHRGHIVDIPDFGRIILGELLLSPDSVQFVSIRAELGCPIKGRVTGPTPAISGGRGSGDTS